MRTFLVTRRGVARVMRTYGVQPSGAVDPEASAPDAEAEIAKWADADRAEVSSVREIDPSELLGWERRPELGQDGYVGIKEAWRDTGTGIDIDAGAARAAQAGHIRAHRARRGKELMQRHFAGEDVEAERQALAAIDPEAMVAGASTREDIKARWPQALERRGPAR